MDTSCQWAMCGRRQISTMIIYAQNRITIFLRKSLLWWSTYLISGCCLINMSSPELEAVITFHSLVSFSVYSFTISCPPNLRNVFGIWPFLSFPLLQSRPLSLTWTIIAVLPDSTLWSTLPAELVSCKTNLIMFSSVHSLSHWIPSIWVFLRNIFQLWQQLKNQVSNSNWNTSSNCFITKFFTDSLKTNKTYSSTLLSF